MLIGSQAFQTHRGATRRRSSCPRAASRGLGPDPDRQRPGRRRNQRRDDRFARSAVGVLYHGLHILGGGSSSCGLILGASPSSSSTAAFAKAAGFALAGAVLTFFGFMHGESIGFANNRPVVALAYVGVAAILFGLSRSPATWTAPQPSEEKAIAATPAE